MAYFWTGLGSFIAGVVVARLWWGKVIGLGSTILDKAEGRFEQAKDAVMRFRF